MYHVQIIELSFEFISKNFYMFPFLNSIQVLIDYFVLMNNFCEQHIRIKKNRQKLRQQLNEHTNTSKQQQQDKRKTT